MTHDKHFYIGAAIFAAFLAGIFVDRMAHPVWEFEEMNPAPFKTLTAYKYGNYIGITARPGMWLIKPEALQEAQADEDRYRKPFELNLAHP